MFPAITTIVTFTTGVFLLTESSFAKIRSRRDTCASKYQVIPNHSACLAPSSTVLNAGVSEADKTVIVDKHNEYRAAVSPTAGDMAKMSWDNEIAQVAQQYAEACKINTHDGNRQRSIPGRLSAGQNLASASYDLGFANAIRLWQEEVKDFTFGGSNVFSKVGHYTQVVWAKSIKIGCGFANCGGTRNYVCNYGPGGNTANENPYTLGTSCSQCSGRCSNNLCDCGGKVCENGGTMDLGTCTCTCPSPSTTYVGDQCKLNCTGQKDGGVCGTTFPASYCDQYTNVPVNCPTMCKVCPYADNEQLTDLSSTVAITDSQGEASTTQGFTSDSTVIPNTNASADFTPAPGGSGNKLLPHPILQNIFCFMILLMIFKT